MSRLMFVYLSGTEKGKTRIFTQEHVTLGTSDACDLKLAGIVSKRCKAPYKFGRNSDWLTVRCIK